MERAAQKIWLARPEILGNEMQYVQDSFESGWITTAFKEDSYIGRFEQSVREYLGGGYPVALQSGTAAIHLALRLCGVEKRRLCILFRPYVYSIRKPDQIPGSRTGIY